MISAISSDWIEKLSTDINHEIRAYINPRGREYGAISSAGTFTAVSSSDNVPGTFNLYQPNNIYILPFEATSTIDVLVKPNFAYTSTVFIAGWSKGSYYVRIRYTSNRFVVEIPGTTINASATFSSDALAQVWHRITVSLNGSTAKTYYNGKPYASGALDTSGQYDLELLQIGDGSNTYINNLRILDYYVPAVDEFYPGTSLYPFEALYPCCDDDVFYHFKDSRNVEVIFDFNKRHCGRERCNISEYLNQYTIDNKSTYAAATASISLWNLDGQFNDDTFMAPIGGLFPSETIYPSATLYPEEIDASFSPQNGYYNGTYLDVFLQRKIPLELEAWNDYTSQNPFETLFIGSIPPGSFSRNVSVGGVSNISVSADDGIADIAKRIVRKNRAYEDYYLTNTSSESTSLFHVISRLATRREVYNYLCNSSFENSTISNSWVVEGGSLSRSSSQALFGTYSGLMSGTRLVQYVNIELSQSERFNFSVFIYSASAMNIQLQILEQYNGVTIGGSQKTVAHDGHGWMLFDVTHDIQDSSSNRLVAVVKPSSMSNIYLDGAMLVYGDYKPYFVNNTNDGTVGICNSSDAVLGSYDWIGIDADTVSYQHPWAVVNEGINVWDYLQQIGDATIARYIYIDRSGVLKYRSTFNTSLPSSLGAIENISAISSSVQSDVANKVKVAGVYINKASAPSCVWQVEASGLENENADGNTFSRTIAAGDYFPKLAEAPDGYEAKYGDAYEGR